MPRYSYTCTNCENTIEAFHSSDERLSFCDKCSHETLKKNLFPVNTIKQINNGNSNKVGSVVKEKIEEIREDLKNYRKELKKELK
jgi:putative FmdB family regulatory protein